MTRIVATVDAAVVVIAILAIHLVAVELDPAVAYAEIQAVVLPPVELLLISVDVQLDVVGGELDAIVIVGGLRRFCGAMGPLVIASRLAASVRPVIMPVAAICPIWSQPVHPGQYLIEFK